MYIANGGIDSMEQFQKICAKSTNSLRNLEYTRDMLYKLAENEKNCARNIAEILSEKDRSLRFSFVDQAVQKYWKKQESNRRHFSEALLSKIIEPLDIYIKSATDKNRKLQKENDKTQNTFISCKKKATKQMEISLAEWQKLEEQIQENEALKKDNKMDEIKDLKPLQDK